MPISRQKMNSELRRLRAEMRKEYESQKSEEPLYALQLILWLRKLKELISQTDD